LSGHPVNLFSGTVDTLPAKVHSVNRWNTPTSKTEREMDDDGPDYRQQQESQEQEQQDPWAQHAKSLKELKELREEMKCTRQKSNSNARSR
jgi:ribosomal protein L19E